MSSQVIDSLVEELNTKLGDHTLVTLRELVDYGIFGSVGAARVALIQGRLPFIRISPRRIAIPRQALLAFLCDNLSEKACILE